MRPTYGAAEVNEMVPAAFRWSWHVPPVSMWVSSGCSGFLSMNKMHPGRFLDQRTPDEHLDLVCQHLTKAAHCYPQDDGSNAANELCFTLVIHSFPFLSFFFFSFLSFLSHSKCLITSIRLAHFKEMAAEVSLPNILVQKTPSIYLWKCIFKIGVDSLMNFESYASVSWLTCILGVFFKFSVSCSPHLLCTVIRLGTTRSVQLAILSHSLSLRSASHYTQCFGSLAEGCAL